MKLLASFTFCIYLKYISCSIFCPKTNKPPQDIQIDTTYTINPVKYKNENYTAVQVGNKIFLNRFNGKLTMSTSAYYDDSSYCPNSFKIPIKEDFESVLKQLGNQAYSILTDPNGFNMEQKSYYLTNTKGTKTIFSKIFMYLDGTSIKFIDTEPKDINGNLSQKAVIRCMLDLSNIKLEFPNNKEDLNINEKVLIKTNSKSLNGYLWKIKDNIYTTETIQFTFSKSGIHKIEFWGSYINGEKVYLCDYAFVKKKPISSSQEYSDSKIKLVETDFEIQYFTQLHFQHSNCPVAPRVNGGYYIAFTDKNKFLHVLSYDRNDKLLKDFNTTEKAYPHDITATDYGFAIYMIEADSSFHSYINLYNKNFEIVNTVQIMNNNKNDNKSIDSNLEKQVIRYDENREPVYGMRFMYEPDNGKLIYSRGRIFLIFCHYNYFINNGGHTGDTVVTFNDVLQDMDFGCNWGSSHSLIQSVTFDEYYFWTAALGDAYPEGINIEYTSKREFKNTYDPVNEKYNLRFYKEIDYLAGYIKGNNLGTANGKLGGIIYFEKYGLYCLIYAKTPNYSNDEKNEKNIIYMTTWEFVNNQIVNNKTIEIKVFENGNVMQIRAGKYGDDKIIIIYAETNNAGGNSYGYVNKGTIPKLYIINVSTLQIIKQDETIDKLLMNTNEDLRTFYDGVLIWATANKNGKLVINKIGTPLLNENNDDIDYILTSNDLIKEEEKEDNENNENNKDNEHNKQEDSDNNSNSFSAAQKVGIAIGIIIGILLIIFVIFMIIRHFKSKNRTNDLESLDNMKLLH